MVYAELGGQTECIMGNWKIENISFTCQVDEADKLLDDSSPEPVPSPKPGNKATTASSQPAAAKS